MYSVGNLLFSRHALSTKLYLTTALMKKSVFGSVVAGAFQIIFRAKIHANNIFSFFKNHF
jgi:hypothetical protein